MEIDGVAISPLFIKKEVTGLQRIFVEPIVEATRFVPGKFNLPFCEFEEWPPVLVWNFHAAYYDDHMAHVFIEILAKENPRTICLMRGFSISERDY